uniref:Rabaptin coiled-coil domain-containing protein n=1 Tax=Branchiostoma floridae TaxID=7739 RepID=C3ZHV6_BRAFL|eukprot:XP_002591889.1 hypothetical protein BRAFLDRAFT_89406 [Branchiostoma floridae]
MKKAQEEAEMLRSVVMPMEKEITSLKEKLRLSQDRIRELEGRVRELNHYLEVEKSSRTDLEMYVAVLNTQKTVLQEDADKLRSELHDVCRLLEEEKRKHAELKKTWELANDQFLESQRLMLADLKRMSGVLSEEQQRQVQELQKQDAEREAQQKRIQQLQQMRDEQERLQQQQQGEGDTLNVGSMSLLERPKSAENLASSQSSEEFGPFVSGDEDRVSQLSFTLTEAQQKAITAQTPENEEVQTLVAAAKASSSEPSASMVGKRLVSDKEWEWLQQEVKAAREKLGRPCDMCSNYEQQLQNVQESEKDVRDTMAKLQSDLEREQKNREKREKNMEELEESVKNAGQDAQQQRLQRENDSLQGKYTLHKSLQQSEGFVMPQGLEELQTLISRYRQNILTVKTSAEHMEDKLRSEIMFLKDRVKAEQVAKDNIEETLSSDLDTKLEAEVRDLRVKIQGLQADLDNSEAVQRDFVKLSQSLQVGSFITFNLILLAQI